jgi:hypothetical protein
VYRVVKALPVIVPIYGGSPHLLGVVGHLDSVQSALIVTNSTQYYAIGAQSTWRSDSSGALIAWRSESNRRSSRGVLTPPSCRTNSDRRSSLAGFTPQTAPRCQEATRSQGLHTAKPAGQDPTDCQNGIFGRDKGQGQRNCHRLSAPCSFLVPSIASTQEENHRRSRDSGRRLLASIV